MILLFTSFLLRTNHNGPRQQYIMIKKLKNILCLYLLHPIKTIIRLDTQKISKVMGYDLCITKVTSISTFCESDIAIKAVFGNM